MNDSVGRAERFDAPFRHWIVSDLLTMAALAACSGLPFGAHGLAGVSGRRELHNETRHYFAGDNLDRHPICRTLANAFQAPKTVAALERLTGSELGGTCLRIEFAQDVDGFWLEPHTDLGVKKFTMLFYLADAPGPDDLGTDLYDGERKPTKRIPFRANTALVFKPGGDTWHGFEPRAIEGVRRSIIVNYVTEDWRAREQLAFPDRPVQTGSNEGS